MTETENQSPEAKMASNGVITDDYLPDTSENPADGYNSKPSTDRPVDMQPFEANPYSWVEPETIPKRSWIWKQHLIRKYVSITVASGGTGKSRLAIAEAISMAIGKSLFSGHEFTTLRVWYWNLEDTTEEITRMIQGTCLHFGVTESDLGGRLFVNGRGGAADRSIRKLCIAQSKSGNTEINIPVIDNFIDTIHRNKIDVVIIDPFVSSHDVNENDNTAIDAVVKAYAQIAEFTNTAIELIHHTRKAGTDPEASSELARGAKSFVDASRSARLLLKMTKSEAEQAGVDIPWAYFCETNEKATHAPPSNDREWYHLKNVDLGNGEQPDRGVGVATAWKWPNPFDDITVSDLKRVQKAIDGKGYRENAQANDWAGHAIADVLDLESSNKTDKAKINIFIKTWIANKALKVTKIIDEKGKSRPILEVGEWAN